MALNQLLFFRSTQSHVSAHDVFGSIRVVVSDDVIYFLLSCFLLVARLKDGLLISLIILRHSNYMSHDGLRGGNLNNKRRARHHTANEWVIW